MTHHTDAERAEFEAWARSYGTWEVKRDDDVALGTTGYTDITLTVAWHAVQAARRAPAAPVPQITELQDSLVAISAAIADQDDSAAQSMLRDVLSMLAAAPQPPEAAPVPQFSRIAQKKLDYLLEAGEAITGYAIENKDGRRGAIDCHGFVYWWQDAAAPQQLANHDIQEQST